MAIIERMGRIEDNFTMIPNDLARDPEISPRAKAVYLYVASHESGWKLNSRSLASQLGMSQDTVNKGLRELESLGWVKRTQTMTEDSKFSTVIYQIFTVTEKLGHVTQNVGHGNVGTEELGHIKKTNSFKKTEVSKKTRGARKRATPAEIESDWRPTDSQWQRHVENHPNIDHEAELRKFRIWNENNRQKRADWNRAFGNWLIRAKPERESWSQLLGVDYSEAEEVKPF